MSTTTLTDHADKSALWREGWSDALWDKDGRRNFAAANTDYHDGWEYGNLERQAEVAAG
jgi:hypothetical protein